MVFDRLTRNVHCIEVRGDSMRGNYGIPKMVFISGFPHTQGWDSRKVSYFFQEIWPAGAYGNREERRVITEHEAATAQTLGEPTRQNHIANLAYSPNATSRTCQ